MAEALAIECPPTPEGQIEFPATPPPRSNARIGEFLKTQKHRKTIMNLQHGDTESGNSDDEQHRLQENASPPPNCSICLGRVKSKCFTNSCMHQFCFSCLLKWSKIKPECPLCKQTFKSIIHNVTSMDNYEEYKVEEHRQSNWGFNYYPPIQPSDAIIFPNLASFGVYRPELAAHNRIYQLFLQESPSTERFARMYAADPIPSRNSGVSWREYVYRRRLYAMPLNDISGQTRIVTADFYRENPAQMHRLIGWLNRELLCLCTSSQYTVSDILRSIEDLIQTYDISSSTFRRRVRAFIPMYSDHFVHEFTNFARSPYDIIGYDRNVMYTPRFDEVDEVVALSSSDESDVSIVLNELSEDSRSASNSRNVRIAEENQILMIPGQNGEQQFVHTLTPSAQISRPTAIVNSSDSNMPYNLTTSNSSNYASTAVARHPATGRSVFERFLNSSDDVVIDYDEDESDESEVATYLTPAPAVNMDTIRGRTGSPVRDSIVNNNGERTVIVSLNVNFGENSNTDTHGGTSATITTSTTSISTTTINVGGIESESTTMTTTTASISNVQVVTEESDSDDCLFVCAKKPPHLRTPEFVELNSDSDSDVVFVNEEKLPSYQVIKREDRGSSNNVIVSPQKTGSTLEGSSSNTSTNIVILNSRRKKRIGDLELLATKDEIKATEIKPLSVISKMCSASSASHFNGISDKPSTSSEWFNSNSIPSAFTPIDNSSYVRPNAIVFSSSAPSTRTNKISLILSRTKRSGKQIFESSSSEQSDNDDDDDDDDDNDEPSTNTLTSSSTSESSTESSSSSHEEYGLRKNLKRKATKTVSPRKKKYYKKTILSEAKIANSIRKNLKKQAETKKLKSSPAKVCKRRKGKSQSRYISPSTTSSSTSECESD